jgi:methionine sulfoxide reductase heme-binding subunit
VKDPTFWMLARASGLLAYSALTASTLLGLLVKARPFRSLSRATVTDLHRFVAFTALGALAVHAIALVLDAAMPMPVRALVIPGLSPYRPIWTSAGVIAAELMILIIVSFPLRRFIGAKGWRRLHWATYATYALAAIHGIASGTDTSRPWVTAFYVATIGSVAAAAVWRALVPPPRRVPAARPARRIPEPATEGARP